MDGRNGEFLFPATGMALGTPLTTPAPAVSSVARRQLPAGLDATLACALAKDRDARYPTVAAFVHALQTVERA